MSVIPILITVSLLYGFVEIAGYSINIVTATIGAVSIGFGIDYAIHLTMRSERRWSVVAPEMTP